MVATSRSAQAGWRRYLGVLLLTWAALVATAAVALSQAQDAATANREREFDHRGRVAATFIGDYAARTPTRMANWASATLAADRVTTGTLATACRSLGFSSCGLFDAAGRLLMNAPYFPDLLGRDFSSLAQVGGALRGGAPVIGAVNISPALQEPVVPFGVPFDTRSGQRVFTGIFRVHDSALMDEANVSFELPDTTLVLVDDADTLMAVTDGSLPREVTALSDVDPELADALRTSDRGEAGARYFSVTPVPGTRWRLVASIDSTSLQQPIGTLSTVTRWALAGWAVAGLVAIAALVRSMHQRSVGASQLARTQLLTEERRRHALEVNDAILQRLVAAETAADLGRADQSRKLLGQATEAARHWIGEQLRDAGPLEPGALRRHAPADAALPSEEVVR